MLDAYQMNELLKRFTYKPGWQFEVFGSFSMVTFAMQVSYPAKDAYSPERDIIVGARRPFTVPHNEEAFWAKLQGIIDYMERHESREWFKVDGKMPFDPHRERV